MMEMNNKTDAPIGVFDSGVGGLTVAREIMRQLPNENMVYFGDTARVPYGSKSKNNIIRFSRQIFRFLRTKHVKAVVIACNTASAFALETLQKETDIPVIGVIVPGARAAVKETRNGKIGVAGTEGTIRSETYKHHITKEVIDIYLSDMKNTDIDTMILGCTHYPLLRSSIIEYFGDAVHIVNPAYETAIDLKHELENKGLVNKSGETASYEFYVSDAAEKFTKFANSILPYDVASTKQINIEEY